MIAPVLSSMCVAGATGILMHKDINMLFDCLLGMSAILLIDGCLLFREMGKIGRKSVVLERRDSQKEL